ncbi:hypothetical protein NW762_012593 [Fusarium torreyae]|uniref:Uncharacterized protein n=1 Tax=Fusarium torreyae TaxID=1237075 RepID=A0A9W8RQU9_9HYPO|nr:hypothetical protein NW762_012593 [Fusarium torreyae]
MSKRFSGFDFWEERFQSLQQAKSTDPETKRNSPVSVKSDDSPIKEATPVVSRNTWPQAPKSTELDYSQPMLIQKVAGVHNVRNSLCVSPSLDHYSQSVSILPPNSHEDKQEHLTVVKNNDRNKRDTISSYPINHRKPLPGSFDTILRPSPLKIETSHLSDAARWMQRHSTLPITPTSNCDKNNTPLQHRHTHGSSKDCTICLTNQTDKASEALANALQDKQQTATKSTVAPQPIKDSDAIPAIRMPTPVRPKIISQHLERTQQWVENQEDYDDSTASSASSPMSPMMHIDVFSKNRKNTVTTEVIPMGYNLDHDLGDWLQWEARNVCAYGYGTSGYSYSP